MFCLMFRRSCVNALYEVLLRNQAPRWKISSLFRPSLIELKISSSSLVSVDCALRSRYEARGSACSDAAPWLDSTASSTVRKSLTSFDSARISLETNDACFEASMMVRRRLLHVVVNAESVDRLTEKGVEFIFVDSLL